ncbi:hypothetical protein EDEG_02777 [Edhazardia aedis USNM 41457]|uniref:Transmembrane protein n=1 Tax=Edhazardia aedis (strain USNM 41457) TaxID=1003232 RepID=J9D4U2_EDHAE|nr:hypothetical protein EDEG_02777 [Edhazardia aedis USNM 41457]|eukprot:EJW02836.1 hypothetical protein EDEG_02777 [Edhazardia aedis USNM 41457]
MSEEDEKNSKNNKNSVIDTNKTFNNEVEVALNFLGEDRIIERSYDKEEKSKQIRLINLIHISKTSLFFWFFSSCKCIAKWFCNKKIWISFFLLICCVITPNIFINLSKKHENDLIKNKKNDFYDSGIVQLYNSSNSTVPYSKPRVVLSVSVPDRAGSENNTTVNLEQKSTELPQKRVEKTEVNSFVSTTSTTFNQSHNMRKEEVLQIPLKKIETEIYDSINSKSPSQSAILHEDKQNSTSPSQSAILHEENKIQHQNHNQLFYMKKNKIQHQNHNQLFYMKINKIQHQNHSFLMKQ